MEEPVISIKANHLQRVVRKALQRSERKLEKQNAEAEEARLGERLQQWGDTLSANYKAVRRGLSSVRLANVHSGEDVEIILDPALSPQENVQEYYRRAAKAKRAGPAVQRQVERTQAEIQFLSALQNRLAACEPSDDTARTTTEIESIENELIARGFLPKAPPAKGPQLEEQGFRRVVLEEKWTILIGRNDAQNDDLTLHVARPHDLWFHAYGSPGSHVVLRRDSKDEPVPQNVVERAASLAAWFSKQKHSTKVAVNYTEKRYVRKPRKAPPGLVMIEREKTIYVRPWNPHESRES